MNYDTAILERELAAYSPAELAEFAETVSILFEAADDGSTHYHVMRHRIEEKLSTAIKAQTAEERAAGQSATIVQFPGKPK